MIAEWLVLAQEIAKERDGISRVVERAIAAHKRAGESPRDRDLFMEAAALNLHAFYTGCERIFESIARRVDRSVPTGAQWHVELLRQMVLDLPSVRPPVISDETLAKLERFRSFRHLIRNLYTFNLSTEIVSDLVGRLPPTFEAVSGDVERFLFFIRNVAEQDP